MELWRVELHSKAWEDPWGNSEPAWQVFEIIEVKETEFSRPVNNGYETYQSRIWATEEGRQFYAMVPIDFAGRTLYHEIPTTTGELRRTGPMASAQWEQVAAPSRRRFLKDGKPFNTKETPHVSQ
jgi:hypothetical protein